ncbi:MAG TPA: hypothetical protein VMW17_15375 [Candidatus Binatia bacterium]|nr:hypothetical protein [Candidatus Binatia bacterium]
MRLVLAGVAGTLVLISGVAGGAEVDSAPPIVEQLLSRSAALELSSEQIQALEQIRERRAHSLAVLTTRLRSAEPPASAAAQRDEVALMQEIGRVQVLSGRDALQQLTPAQRQRWVILHRPTPGSSPAP